MRSLVAVMTRSHSRSLATLGLMTLTALLTGAAAQVSFKLWFTPVPVTLQVLAVLASAMLLGRKAALAQIEYILLGLAGMPIFAMGTAGPAVLLGPSGGYLAGFVLAAWVAGSLAERLGEGRRRTFGLLLAGLAGVASIHACGGIWLAVWLMVTGNGQGASAAAFGLGIAPFALLDIIKAVVAAAATLSMGRGISLIK